MEAEHDDETLARVEQDPTFSGGLDPALVKAFRKVMQFIRNAKNQLDLGAMRSLRFEKLKGKRGHQYSMRLTRQWRLIVELESASNSQVVRVKGIEDYH